MFEFLKKYDSEAHEIIKAVKADSHYKDGIIHIIGERALKPTLLYGLLLASAGLKYDADQVIAAVKAQKDIHEDGILVSRSRYDGHENPAIDAKVNSLWGLLLNSTGNKSEAKFVVHVMKSYDRLYNKKDGLVRICVNPDGKPYWEEPPMDDTQLHSSRNSAETGRLALQRDLLTTNSLWGLLLSSTGYINDAQIVINSIDPNLETERSGSVIGHGNDYEWSRGGLIGLESNCYWGMLLKSTNHKFKAGMVGYFFRYHLDQANDIDESSYTSITPHIIHGIFLSSIGQRKRARKQIKKIRNLVEKAQKHQDATETRNLLWAMLLLRNGYRAFVQPK
jgi:hypothetical protein